MNKVPALICVWTTAIVNNHAKRYHHGLLWDGQFWIGHSQELSKSDLQAGKIRLVQFLGMFHISELRIKPLNFLQWQSIGIYDVSIVNDRRLLGINTKLKIDPKTITYTV